MIEITNVTHSYKNTSVLRNLDISVKAGERYGLLGRNGAGKTTTLKILSGLVVQKSGTSRLLSKDSRKLGLSEWNRTAYISENQRFYDWYTGRQLIEYISSFYLNWDEKYSEMLISRMAFSQELDRKIKQYSRGEKIKLALILNLSYKPEIIILDEPFSGLDVLVKEEFSEILFELISEYETTIFITSHEMDEVENLVTHVGILENSELVIEGTLNELLSKYKKLFFKKSSVSKEKLIAAGISEIKEFQDEYVCIDEKKKYLGLPEELRRLGSDEKMSLKDLFKVVVKTALKKSNKGGR